MKIGFTAITVSNDVEFRLFGNRTGKQSGLITLAQDSGQRAILFGRLYYRADLLAQLPEPSTRGNQASDADLALAMYKHFGSEGLTRLEGDFALVIWSPREGRLIGVRDPMGGYPLFWTQQGETIAVSTSMRRLVELLPGCSLNSNYLAEFLVLPGCGVSELPGEECVYQGIHRVQPGSMIEVHVPSRHITREVYWKWLDQMVDPGTERLDEIAAQYGELLRRAVRERLRGRVACHFSGGMDSTAVALLARQELQSRMGEPLHALSLVYDKFPVLAGEKAYISEALGQQDGLIPHEVRGENCLDFDVCGNPPHHEEPWASLWRSGMNKALVDSAAQSGADTVLTGFGADEMLHIPPLHLTELLRKGRPWAAWQEAARWARAGNCSAWQLLCPFGINNLLPPWIRPGLGHLLRGGYTSWQNQRQWSIAPWILPSFARQYSLRGRAIEHLRRTYSSCRPVSLSVALAATTYNAGDVVRWSLAAQHGIVTAHPFFDSRVVGFGLGMQTRLNLEPGRQKPVLGEAMRDILPESIRNRRLKVHCNEVYYLGLARNLRALEELVQTAPIDDLHILNKDTLLKCLQQAALGIAGDAAGVDRLTLTLSLLKWLSMRAESPSFRESHDEVVWVPRKEVPTRIRHEA
jgi:asparagine synthase (glutamine-hydrolysing)